MRQKPMGLANPGDNQESYLRTDLTPPEIPETDVEVQEKTLGAFPIPEPAGLRPLEDKKMMVAIQFEPISCMQEELLTFSCQNEMCEDLGRQGNGNLRIDGHYGRSKTTRLLYCKTCRTRFSERKGSVLFGAQLSPDMVVQIFQHLNDGRGIRETARVLGVNRNTVSRYNRLRKVIGVGGQGLN